MLSVSYTTFYDTVPNLTMKITPLVPLKTLFMLRTSMFYVAYVYILCCVYLCFMLRISMFYVACIYILCCVYLYFMLHISMFYVFLNNMLRSIILVALCFLTHKRLVFTKTSLLDDNNNLSLHAILQK